MNSTPFANYNYTPTMDNSSIISSDISEGLMSHDTFDLNRRARQDTTLGRLDRPFTSRFAAPDLSFHVSSSSDPVSSACSSTTCSVGKRKVNFAGCKVINEGASESISEEETSVRWWSQDDLDDIKKAAKEMSLRLRKLAKERGCYVETAYKKTSLMLTNDFQELVKMSASSPDQDLLHWCARSDGRRGLERFASREYGNTRKGDVLAARGVVFEEQERQRKLQVYVPETMAKVAKAKSRRSRTFSLFMGEADAQAAARGVTRNSSKRVKVSHSSPQQQQQHQQQKQQRRSTPPRSFPVDAPLLTSSA